MHSKGYVGNLSTQCGAKKIRQDGGLNVSVLPLLYRWLLAEPLTIDFGVLSILLDRA